MAVVAAKIAELVALRLMENGKQSVKFTEASGILAVRRDLLALRPGATTAVSESIFSLINKRARICICLRS